MSHKINSAPRDKNRLVLVFDPDEGWCTARYGGDRAGVEWWVPHPASPEGELLHPTHWTDLPKDPA